MKLVKTGRNFELEGEKLAKILNVQRPNLYAQRTFQADFEALPEVQIEFMIARWKSLSVYYPTQVEFIELVSIFPSKIAIAQDWFLLVKKVA